MLGCSWKASQTFDYLREYGIEIWPETRDWAAGYFIDDKRVDQL